MIKIIDQLHNECYLDARRLTRTFLSYTTSKHIKKIFYLFTFSTKNKENIYLTYAGEINFSSTLLHRKIAL